MYITWKNTWFNYEEYCNLLYNALSNVINKDNQIRKIKIVKPFLVKPKMLWSGKQLFTNIFLIVASIDDEHFHKVGINLTNKARVNESYFSKTNIEDATIRILNSEIMTGIFDKNQIGATMFGYIHAFFEVYGNEKTGYLCSAISRLCVSYLKFHGFTCGMDDLMVTNEFDAKRLELLKSVKQETILN